MKTGSIILSLLAAVVMAACVQTPEERIKAFEEAHEAMMNEYTQMMDSLAGNQEQAQAFYNDLLK